MPYNYNENNNNLVRQEESAVHTAKSECDLLKSRFY